MKVLGTFATLLAGLMLGGCAAEAPPDRGPATEAPVTEAPTTTTTTEASADDEPDLLWADEFDAPAGTLPDPAKWTAEVGGEWGDNELQQYTARPENAVQDGEGHLVITANKETYTGPDGLTHDYTSARLTTYEKFDFRYGKVEARIKVPHGKGLVAGFWGLGADIHDVGWPECGEFDVIEVNGETPRVAHGSLHGPGVGEHGWAQTGTYEADEPLSHDWHVYGAEWTPEGFEFSIDGHVYSRREPSGLPGGARWTFDDRNYHLLLTLSVGGPWAGEPAADLEWPKRMLVDWIRVTRP